MLLAGSGCAFLYGFCIRYREFFPPFLGSGASLLFSSSLPFSSSSPSLLVAGLGGPSFSSSARAGRIPDFRYQYRPEPMPAHVFFFLFLSARVGRRSPSLPPSFCPLSLSLSFSSLSVLHALLRGTGGNNRYVTSFAVLGCTRDTFS